MDEYIVRLHCKLFLTDKLKNTLSFWETMQYNEVGDKFGRNEETMKKCL